MPIGQNKNNQRRHYRTNCKEKTKSVPETSLIPCMFCNKEIGSNNNNKRKHYKKYHDKL